MDHEGVEARIDGTRERRRESASLERAQPHGGEGDSRRAQKRADECDVVRIEHMETLSPFTVYGMKGTGEGGVANGAPQINNLPNTLGDRLDGATGIVAKYGTVLNFVEATITSGVRGTAMPRWSARLGGPLRDDQIQNIASYVSGWWGPAGSTSAAFD